MYTDVSEVKKVMRSLPQSSKLSDTDIQFFIEQAESQVDAFLREIYHTPFIVVPSAIKKVSLDLAVYYLTESLYTSFQPNQMDGNQVRYDRSMEILKMIRNGDILLEGAEPLRPFTDIGYDSTFDGELFFKIDSKEGW